MTEEGTGYLQQNFTMKCINQACSFEITRDTLGLRKLANDLSIPGVGNRASDFLAGTVHTPTNVLNLDHGKLVKESMLSSPRRPLSVSNATYAAYLIEMSNYRLDRVKKGELVRRLEGVQGGKLSAFFFG